MAKRKTNIPRLVVDDSFETSGSVTAGAAATFEDEVAFEGNVGFFGTTPVGQQNVPATSPDVDDIITALVALGLVEQSDP